MKKDDTTNMNHSIFYYMGMNDFLDDKEMTPEQTTKAPACSEACEDYRVGYYSAKVKYT